MTRHALALILVGALVGSLGCSGKGPSAKTPEAPGKPMLAQRISLSWGIQQVGEAADLFLQTTDETGKQVSHELGRYKGTCAVATPAAEMNALTAVDCKTGGTGTELQAVVHGGDEIIVVKLGIDEGVKPDPMARDEVKRIKVPLGTKIEVLK
jgi:hypothetical protein